MFAWLPARQVSVIQAAEFAMVEHRIKHHALHRLGTFLLSCRIRLGLDITVAVDEKLTHCPVWVWQLVPKMVMQKSIGILWSSAAAWRGRGTRTNQTFGASCSSEGGWASIGPDQAFIPWRHLPRNDFLPRRRGLN